MTGFIHLRVHSAYSLLEGAIPVKSLAGLCQDLAMPAIAVTDTGNLFGALEISEALSKDGIQPIIGCTLPVLCPFMTDQRGHFDVGQMVFLAQSEEGYLNLLRMMKQAYMEGPDDISPSVTLQGLDGMTAGIIALTGGAGGPLGQALLTGQEKIIPSLTDDLTRLFPDRLYVELQRHGMEEEIRTEDQFVELAYKRGLPLVATNDVCFAKANMFEAHDALICIAEGSYVSQDNRRRMTPEHWLKPPKDMRALFVDLPEACATTVDIAKRCAYRPLIRDPILPGYNCDEGLNEDQQLKLMAEEGLRARLSQVTLATDEQDYWDRLAFELGVISQMGFPGYFLIVTDFIHWAKGENIPVGPGRGSGAGSLVAWSLTITDLDPLRFGLLFERFLNPERVSMPDFDIDFCPDRRDDVIQYVQKKYGHDHVAQIITFGKLQARAVLRDVGRVLQMPYGQVDRLCKLVPNNPANPVTLAEAVAGEERLREEKRNDPSVDKLISISLQLEGLYRHASTHAAGVVIGDRPLHQLVPIYRDPRSDMPVTQFNMKWVEPAGLVKFDFLGLKTLTILQRTCEHLADRGIEVVLADIPLDDVNTFEMLSQGDSIGVFQFESSGMRDLLRQAEPSVFDDLIALVALFRPGPMENIPKYLACKHGKEQPDELHPLVEDVVSETYGVIIYQEQVLQIAQKLSGYSLGEADLLRRAMGKKIQAEMDQQKARFVTGAIENGVTSKRADYIFELVNKFAGYGFNKCHSAGYALLAYQTAYLKANYPTEFMSAVMTLDMGNTDKLSPLKQELDRMSISLEQPDVNRSGVTFLPIDGKVRYALGAIKNVGASAMASLVSEREANGEFVSLTDFARRIDPRLINRRALENLIKGGALDPLNSNRAQTFCAVNMVLAEAAQSTSDRLGNQQALFDGLEEGPPDLPLHSREDWLPFERLTEEFSALGFYLSAHPLDDYMPVLKQNRVIPYTDVVTRAKSRSVKALIAGTISKVMERRSARGNRFAFVELSDPTGVYEVAIFSDLLRDHRDLLEAGKSVILGIEAEQEAGQPRLKVTSIRPIEKLGAREMRSLKIYVRDGEPLEQIKARLPDKGRGEISLVMMLQAEAREVEFKLPGGFALTPQTRGAIRAINGVVEVEEI